MGSEWIFIALGIVTLAAGIGILVYLYIRREKQYRDAEAWYNTGLGISHLGRLENNPALFRRAIECYDNALEIRENYPEALNNKGNALYYLARYTEAIEYFERALELTDKRAPEAWNNKGNALAELHRYQEAIECYDHALLLRPDYPEAWNNKGNTLTKFGRHEEAVKCLSTALKIRRDYPEALYNLAVSFAELKDKENCIKALKQALKLRPILKNRARPNPAFAYLWDDEDFRRQVE
jgi:superkiller protein 3